MAIIYKAYSKSIVVYDDNILMQVWLPERFD